MKKLPNPQDYHQTSYNLIAVFLLCCIPKPMFVSGFLYPQTNLYTHEVCFSFALHCQKYHRCSTFYCQKENLRGKACPALGLGWFEANGQKDCQHCHYKSITEYSNLLLPKGKPMRQGQTSPKRPTDADRHCLAAVQNFTQVAVFHSSLTFLHFLILFIVLRAANLDWIVRPR